MDLTTALLVIGGLFTIMLVGMGIIAAHTPESDAMRTLRLMRKDNGE